MGSGRQWRVRHMQQDCSKLSTTQSGDPEQTLTSVKEVYVSEMWSFSLSDAPDRYSRGHSHSLSMWEYLLEEFLMPR